MEAAGREHLLRNNNGHSPQEPCADSIALALRSGYPDESDEVLEAARHYFQEEKRFRALIENSSDAIFLMNRDCKLIYASASTKRVLGYEPETLIGRDRFE